MQPWIDPYIYITSQWQIWSLFSPEPFRGVTGHVIEAFGSTGWVPVYDVDAQVRWWREADELRIQRQLYGTDRGKPELQRRYLRSYCTALGIQPGIPLRFVFLTHYFPPENPRFPEDWWHSLGYGWTRTPGERIVCPRSSRSQVAPILFP
jgi:hypothetical protein